MTLGLVVVPFALVGAALDYWRQRSGPHVLHSVCATLLLLYVLFGPTCYFYHLLTTGDGYVGFTPSRFLSDLAYFFSVFAGIRRCFASRNFSAEWYGYRSHRAPGSASLIFHNGRI